MKQGHQQEKRKERIKAIVRLEPQSEIRKLEILVNGSLAMIQQCEEQSTWSAECSVTGPLDFSLAASGTGFFFFSLGSGQQVVLRKTLPFVDGAARFAMAGIPLMI